VGRNRGLILVIISLGFMFTLIGIISLYSSSYLGVSDLSGYSEPVRVRVMGILEPDSLTIDSNGIKFTITDGYSSVDVYYSGIIQIDIAAGIIEVMVEGIYYPGEDIIMADKILYRCPSKADST